MSWRAITFANIRLSPAEKTAIESVQGSAVLGTEVLLGVVREFVGCCQAAGTAANTDDTIPDSARVHIENRTRWLVLTELVRLPALQTRDRKDLNTAAEEYFAGVRLGEIPVEPPTEQEGTNPRTGTWNSENRLNMRTHPVPRPPAAQPTDGANTENDE